jgi:chromosome segregation ATPase
MGRIAKTSPDEIARACAKLQVEGNLTIHSLRNALGGGGAEYLARSLRAWRQQQREEVRTPIEQLISAGLKVALTEELQRAQAEAAGEVHDLYAEDKAHLEFCLSELKRLEKEVDALHDRLTAEQADAQRAHHQAESVSRDLSAQLQEHRSRADRMTERFEDLQRQHQGSQAELAVAREQRSVAEASLAQERAGQEAVRAQLSTATADCAAAGAQVAALEERCNQQQETLGYFRADLRGKSEELGTSRTAMAALQQEFREASRAAAAAESALQELRMARRGLSSRQHVQGLLLKKGARTAAKAPESSKQSRAATGPRART